MDVPNNAISAPKLADFLLHLFRIELAWHTTGYSCSAILAFWEPKHLHKASNHPIIFKSVHNFLQHPLTYKHFDAWYVECLLSLLGLASGPLSY